MNHRIKSTQDKTLNFGDQAKPITATVKFKIVSVEKSFPGLDARRERTMEGECDVKDESPGTLVEMLCHILATVAKEERLDPARITISGRLMNSKAPPVEKPETGN